jgi:integrase
MANANGEGSIFPWSRNGKQVGYRGAITYRDHNGKLKRAWASGRTRKEVHDKLDQARDRLKAGAPVKDSTRTVADFLGTWRDTTLAASDRKHTTKVLYSGLSRHHLEASPLGRVPLDKLRPNHIEALILELRTKHLADSTVRQVYTVLRQALDIAVRDGLLAANPAAKVKRPGVARKEARYLEAAEVTRLLQSAVGLRYHLAVVVMAATGLRRGEVAALRWDALDLNKGELAVRHTLCRLKGQLVLTEPKTERSRRRVPLPAPVIAALKAWRTQQLQERLHAGTQWTDTGAVFATEFGTHIDPRNLLRTVELAAQKAGLENVGAHSLRHSAAVGWLENGVHIKAAADLLGHGSIAVTGDLYGHVTDATARNAVDGWGQALGL